MNYTKNIHKYEGFKLLSLDLLGNSLMGKSNLKYNFVDPDDSQSIIYTTVLIGANGTGKSNLFRIIIELLKEIDDLSRNRSRSYNVDGHFNLTFSVHGDIFEYSNFTYDENKFDVDSNIYLLRNGEKIPFVDAQLPLAIVANSIMLTDKFPFYRKEESKDGKKVDSFPRYKYLGVRNIPQSASTRAYVRRTVEFIVEQFERKDTNNTGFIDALTRATNFLELENSIDIFYFTSNTAKFFKGKLTPKVLDDYFEPIRAKYSKIENNPPFKLSHYLKIKGDKVLLKSICDFCNTLFEEHRLEKLLQKNSSIRKVRYNLIEPKLYQLLNAEFHMLERLRQLGILSSPEIALKRVDGYSLQESSSGEYHFFSSIVGLMATVRPTNSLVLIDEPEISLHPNWQMKYLSFLRELFSHQEYATCHILIATHSHFLISDLKGESSKIIGLKRSEKGIETINLPKEIDTFGWSAEDVLYKVFSVRTTRNHYIEVDMRILLNAISEKKNNKTELEEIVDRLQKVRFNNADPLNLLLNKAKDYIETL